MYRRRHRPAFTWPFFIFRTYSLPSSMVILSCMDIAPFGNIFFWGNDSISVTMLHEGIRHLDVRAARCYNAISLRGAVPGWAAIYSQGYGETCQRHFQPGHRQTAAATPKTARPSSDTGFHTR
jgi:hypothetical protein